MENKLLKTLLVIICSAICGVLIYFNLTIEVPMFKTTMASGDVITSEMVTTKRIFKSEFTDDFYSNGLDLIGKSVVSDVAPNIPVAKALTQAPVKPAVDVDNSKVAIVPVSVRPENVPANLKTGDLINILASFDGGVVDGEAFVIGYSYIATVSNITYDESGGVSKIDCIVDKELAVDISASVALGNIYIIKNEDINDVELSGTTARDLLNKYYNLSEKNEEPTTEETVEPKVEEE